MYLSGERTINNQPVCIISFQSFDFIFFSLYVFLCSHTQSTEIQTRVNWFSMSNFIQSHGSPNFDSIFFSVWLVVISLAVALRFIFSLCPDANLMSVYVCLRWWGITATGSFLWWLHSWYFFIFYLPFVSALASSLPHLYAEEKYLFFSFSHLNVTCYLFDQRSQLLKSEYLFQQQIISKWYIDSETFYSCISRAIGPIWASLPLQISTQTNKCWSDRVIFEQSPENALRKNCNDMQRKNRLVK